MHCKLEYEVAGIYFIQINPIISTKQDQMYPLLYHRPHTTRASSNSNQALALVEEFLKV